MKVEKDASCYLRLRFLCQSLDIKGPLRRAHTLQAWSPGSGTCLGKPGNCRQQDLQEVTGDRPLKVTPGPPSSISLSPSVMG